MTKDSKLIIVLRGIIQENPILILILGTCPTLATTTSVISAFSMGIAATIVLVCSNIVISALRKGRKKPLPKKMPKKWQRSLEKTLSH